MAKIRPISEFERLARRLIEGSINRILEDDIDLKLIAEQLISAADESEIDGVTANEYTIHVNPAQVHDSFARNSSFHMKELEKLLANYLAETSRSAAGPLNVGIILDGIQDSRRFTIEVKRQEDHSELTRRYQNQASDSAASDIADVEAYLIVDRKRHLPITKAVTTIGRNLGNDIVIESPTVSRQHAQIKWRYGRFILHDLGSKSGTRVNGHTISDSVLVAGDVIEVGNAKLIYGDGGDKPVRVKENEITKGDTKPLSPTSKK